MMEQMRNKATKVVVWILSIFLIASFALWGIGDMFRGRSTATAVAEVGDTEVSRIEVQEQFRRVVDTMRARLGNTFDSQQAVQFGLLDEVLDRIVNGRLVSLEARRLGLDAGEAQIAATIRNAPQFRGPGSGFDANRYHAFLRQERMGEDAYVAIVRDEILRSQLTGAVIGGAAVPKSLVALLYRYRNEQRVADVVTVPLGDVSSIPDPDPATLAAFHKENAGLFTAPEYRKAVVLYLDPAERAKEIRPPEERIREEYEHRLPQISVPERRKLSQILLQDEEKAKQAAEALKQGKDFDTVAKELGGGGPVDLGDLRQQDLPKDIADAAFKAEEGSVAGPVRSPLGWHLIRVGKIAPGTTPSYDEVRGRIGDDLARELAVDGLIKLTADVDDSLAGGATLEATAEKVNAGLLKIEAIDANGRDRNGSPVPGIPSDPKFMQQLFSAPVGQLGVLEETAQGGFFLIRVEESEPPTLRPLDEVRKEAVEAWKRTQLADAAKKKAEAVAAAARQAGGLAPAARTAELEVKTSKPFTRFTRDPSSPVPDALAGALFNAKPGEIVVSPVENGTAIGELRQIIAADPGSNEDERKQLQTQLESAMADDILGQYLVALRKRHPVTVDRQALDSVVSGGNL
jgi:peptidyl-prolyl cis-trans isomerase D